MERRLSCVAVGVVTALAVGCGDGPAQEEAIRDVLREYYGAFTEGDWDAVQQLFWPGSDITTIWRPPGESARRVIATSVERLAFDAPPNADGAGVREWLIDAEIRVSGPLAQAWVQHGGERTGDPALAWRGVDAFALLRHDGTWRIASLVFEGGVKPVTGS